MLRLLFRPRSLMALVFVALSLLGYFSNFLTFVRMVVVLVVFLILAAIAWCWERSAHIRLIRGTIFRSHDLRWLNALKTVVELEWHRHDARLKKDLIDVVRLRIESELLTGESDLRKGRLGDVLQKWAATAARADRPADRPVIVLDDWFALNSDEKREPLENYFSLLETFFPRDESDNYHSLTEVIVPSVYVAPLSLVRGLLTEFKLDWGPAIQSFERTLRDPTDWLSRRDVQMFIFDCWLLWGPSVQICDCEQWQPLDPERPYLFSQVGFGDENNSMHMYLRRDVLPALAALRTPPNMPVSKVQRLTVRLLWSRYFAPHGNFPKAQQAILGLKPEATGSTPREVEHPRLLLDYVSHEVGREVAHRDPAYYYSAYLWVIFVILRDGDLPKDHGTHPWKHMLTVFEHGNIADEETFKFLQHQLAIKTARALDDLARNDPAVSFAYVCAFDDSGCTGAPVKRFPAPTAHTLVHDYLKTIAGPAVRARISVPCECGPAAGAAACGPWLQLAPRLQNDLKQYNACHLHQIADKFFEDIRREQTVVGG